MWRLLLRENLKGILWSAAFLGGFLLLLPLLLPAPIAASRPVGGIIVSFVSDTDDPRSALPDPRFRYAIRLDDASLVWASDAVQRPHPMGAKVTLMRDERTDGRVSYRFPP